MWDKNVEEHLGGSFVVDFRMARFVSLWVVCIVSAALVPIVMLPRQDGRSCASVSQVLNIIAEGILRNLQTVFEAFLLAPNRALACTLFAIQKLLW